MYCKVLVLTPLVCVSVVMLYAFYICIYQTSLGVLPRREPAPVFQKYGLMDNMTELCEGCSIDVPNTIIQYGPPRTATTLQFQILCLIMCLLHEDEIQSVGCYFQNTPPNVRKKYLVIKTHTIGQINIPLYSWVFLTSRPKQTLSSNQSRVITNIKNKSKVKIPLTVDLNMVSKRGHFIAYEYQSVFGLSDDKMEIVIEYLRYWVILRQCCGRQMSADWRNQLDPKPNFKPHHTLQNPAYPACEMYNITKVEQLLMSTYAFKKFAHFPAVSGGTGKPAAADGQLTGTYCEVCNRNITRKHLKFNQRCS